MIMCSPEEIRNFVIRRNTRTTVIYHVNDFGNVSVRVQGTNNNFHGIIVFRKGWDFHFGATIQLGNIFRVSGQRYLEWACTERLPNKRRPKINHRPVSFFIENHVERHP
eukprot:128341_1